MSSKSMTIVIPIMGGLAESKPFWGTLLASVQGQKVNLVVIDNAQSQDVEVRDGILINHKLDFFGKFLAPFWPGRFDYWPQETNIGVINSMQLAYERLPESDILAFLHNDLYIYSNTWVLGVKNTFANSKIGLIGFFGGQGIHQGGGRFSCYSNMLEAEIHGWRTDQVRQVAVLDGMAMFASRKMLAERNGVDTSFDIHHFYDLDLSLESLDRGYENWVLPTPIHHQSGTTACRPIFQQWANDYVEGGERILYERNRQRLVEKWDHRLPYEITKGWGGLDN